MGTVRRSSWLLVLCVFAAATAATAVIAAFGLDPALSARFYDPASGWPLTEDEPWRFLYRYGNWFAHAITGLSLAALLLSPFWRRAREWRRKALYFVLVALIGPGIIVNYGFKANWGRPRPRQTVEFGGSRAFLQPWQPDHNPKGNSFPSGHASYAFFMATPYFVVRRKKPALAKGFLAGGLSYGALMGAARIVQGAHFLTDVIWAGTFVLTTAVVMADLVEPEKEGASTGGCGLPR